MLAEIRGGDLLRHIEASDFDGEVDQRRAEAVIVAAHQDAPETTEVPGEKRTAQIAVISVRGMMTKYGSSLSSAGSMIRLRRAVRQADRSSDVDGTLLVFDTPGGTVAGTADFAAEIARAAKHKPIFGFAEDLVASAGYWCISQCSRVYANDSTALIGSIGTYIGLYDFSGALAKEGIEAIVIRAGEMKGAAFPGTEITDEQKAYFQGIVDKTQASFTTAVAMGRGLAEERVPVDGKVYMADDAQSLGLIDGIKTFDEVLGELATTAMQRQADGARGQTKTLFSISQPNANPDTEMAEKEKTTPATETPKTASPVTAEPLSEATPLPDTMTVSGVSLPDDVITLQAELAELRAGREADAERLASLEAERRRADFAAFAKEHAARILPSNAEACIRVMEVLSTYDAVLATEAEQSALEHFKAFIGALPVAYSTSPAKISDEDKEVHERAARVVQLPAGAAADPARMEAVARIQAHAEEHKLTFDQALMQVGREALLA